MQSAPVESILPEVVEDCMPLNEADRSWVRERIGEAQRRQGWGKLTGFIKDWSGAGGVVAIILFALLQWGGYTEFKTRTGLRLDGIEGHLDKIDTTLLELRAAQAPDDVLHEVNGLDQAKFAKSIPALHVAVERPASRGKANRPLLSGIAEKLSKTNPATPEYWPTVLQFLQFASAGLAPTNVPPPNTPPILRSSNTRLAGNSFTGVTVLLDGGELLGTRFENCRVIFTDTPVTMRDVTFANSVFEFPVSSVPPPYIQRASKLLLASDLKTASIPNL